MARVAKTSRVAKLTERLIEDFVLKGSKIVAAGDAARIDAMLRDELVKVADAEGGWTVLYQHKTTGTFWEVSYPNSGMHGGGPRQLVELSEESARAWPAQLSSTSWEVGSAS